MAQIVCGEPNYDEEIQEASADAAASSGTRMAFTFGFFVVNI